jgi:hypothetical protein
MEAVIAGIFSYSTTAGSNTSIGGVSVAEGMNAAGVNNAIRALCADIATSFASSRESFLNGTAGLAVTAGGTGATTASAALSNLGGLSSTYIGAVMTTKTGAFSFSSSDYGKGIRYTGAAADGTLPSGLTVGSVIPVRVAHNASGDLTIQPSGVTLYLAGATASSSTITFAVGSFGGLFCEAADTWVAYGTGVS